MDYQLVSAYKRCMRTNIKQLICALAVISTVSACGCSSDGRAGVEGKVSFAGTPLDVAAITFIPQSGTGVKSGGLIENGVYKVEPKIGPEPGPHRVEIRWAKATGKKYKNEFGEEIEVRQEGLPEKFHAKSTLTADIKSGENVIDFTLEN